MVARFPRPEPGCPTWARSATPRPYRPREDEEHDEEFRRTYGRCSLRSALGAIVALSLASQAAPATVMAQSAPGGSQPAACVEFGVNDPVSLSSRIGRPDPAIVEIFSGAGATAISAHELTPEELTIVNRALARLPRLHRDVLERHLRRLSFLDLQPGSGSALTSRAGLEETSSQFDITLRASLLGESLTAFLNAKEARLFEDDGSGSVSRSTPGRAMRLPTSCCMRRRTWLTKSWASATMRPYLSVPISKYPWV